MLDKQRVTGVRNVTTDYYAECHFDPTASVLTDARAYLHDIASGGLDSQPEVAGGGYCGSATPEFAVAKRSGLAR